MRVLYIAVGLVALQVAAMIGGAFSASTVFIAVGFCSMPFAWCYLGWSLHASGFRVAFGTDQPGAARPAARPVAAANGVKPRRSRVRGQNDH